MSQDLEWLKTTHALLYAPPTPLAQKCRAGLWFGVSVLHNSLDHNPTIIYDAIMSEVIRPRTAQSDVTRPRMAQNHPCPPLAQKCRAGLWFGVSVLHASLDHNPTITYDAIMSEVMKPRTAQTRIDHENNTV